MLGGAWLFLAGVMSKIGSYSYSLYLTHVFVVLAVHRVMYDMSEFTYFSVFWGVVVVVVSLMLAKVYWYFVEDKSIDMYRRVLNA